jgi:hypothetical protein
MPAEICGEKNNEINAYAALLPEWRAMMYTQTKILSNFQAWHAE